MSSDSKPDLTNGGATTPTRVRQLEADGHRWTVHETAAPAFDRRTGTHLLFDCESVVRRVRNFPANWAELSNDALYALTDQAASRLNAEPGV